MSHDGKCPDIYDCRYSDADFKRIGNTLLKSEVAVLEAELAKSERKLKASLELIGVLNQRANEFEGIIRKVIWDTKQAPLLTDGTIQLCRDAIKRIHKWPNTKVKGTING